jgi:hypothetical protein
MKTLKESLLSDLDTQFDQGETLVNNHVKLNTVIPLILDEQSAHFTCYSQSVWYDYEGGFTPKTFLGKFTKNYGGGADELKHEGQPAWEKLFKMAKTELDEISFNDMVNKNKYKSRKYGTFMVFLISTDKNEYKHYAKCIEIMFIEKDYSTGRLKWIKSAIHYTNLPNKVNVLQSFANIKSNFMWKNDLYNMRVFDVDSNPDWHGLMNELRKTLHIEKLTIR